MSEQADNSGREHPAKLHMDKALRLVSGARREKYGPPEKNFQRIAWLWNAYIHSAMDARYGGAEFVGLDAKDVCMMLDDVKRARLIETPDHEDSIIDRFGYQACYVDIVNGEREAKQPPDPIPDKARADDPDDAPEWTQEQWDHADLYHGDKLVPRGQPNEAPAARGPPAAEPPLRWDNMSFVQGQLKRHRLP